MLRYIWNIDFILPLVAHHCNNGGSCSSEGTDEEVERHIQLQEETNHTILITDTEPEPDGFNGTIKIRKNYKEIAIKIPVNSAFFHKNPA